MASRLGPQSYDSEGRPVGAQPYSVYSVVKEEKNWVEIQKITFTNWCNQHLKKIDEQVDDLATCFEDGIKLILLVEVVSQKKVGRYSKNPKIQSQKYENVTAALRLVENDGIKLVNIGNEDIVNGNLKLILGLIWRLILHYQISSRQGVSGKRLLVTWLQNAVPDLKIHNVTTDWNNGIALSGLLEFLQPGTFPNYKTLNPSDSLANVTRAMKIAEEKFGIPQILSPEFFISPYVDELSMMTYLSFFTVPGSPGEAATLRYVNSVIPEERISNFNTDWNDGKSLCKFVETVSPGSIPHIDRVSQYQPEENAKVALDTAEEELNIKKIITPEEVASSDTDELSLMAYLLQFRNCPGLESKAHVFTAEGQGLSRARKGKPADFKVRGPVGAPFEKVVVEIHFPSGSLMKLPHGEKDGLDSMKYKYTTTEAGTHKIHIKHRGKHIPRSPFAAQVEEEVIHVTVSGPGLQRSNVSEPAEFAIKCSAPLQLSAIAEGPTTRSPVNLNQSPDGKTFTASFVPKEVGTFKVKVDSDGRPVPGSPFIVKVSDPNKCVLIPKDGADQSIVNKPAHFTVDTSKAGPGDLHVTCKSPSESIANYPIDVRPLKDGLFSVTFTPKTHGEYITRFSFNGKDIPRSPYTTSVSDTGKCVLIPEDGALHGSLNKLARFKVDTSKAGPGDLFVTCQSPLGSNYPVDITSYGNGLYSVTFTPKIHGEYTTQFSFNGQEIPRSPYRTQVSDTNKISIIPKDGTEYATCSKPAEFDVDTRQAGPGDLRATCQGPSGSIYPVEVKSVGNGRYVVGFNPKTPGEYITRLTFNGQELSGSPLSTVVIDPGKCIIIPKDGAEQGSFNKLSTFIVDTSKAGPGKLHVSCQSPEGINHPVDVKSHGNDQYLVTFSPKMQGEYITRFKFSGYELQRSPMKTQVVEYGECIIVPQDSGEHGSYNKPASFIVDTSKAGPGELHATCQNPAGIKHPVSIKLQGKDKYLVTISPTMPGEYITRFTFNGQELPQSPMKTYATDSSRCVIIPQDGAENGSFDKPANFFVDTSKAGPGELHVTCQSPAGINHPINIKPQGNGQYLVTFSPKMPGEYITRFTLNGEELPKSPLRTIVVDAGRCVITPKDGAEQGSFKKPSRFNVDTSKAGPGELHVTCKSPMGTNHPVAVRSVGNGLYNVHFTPKTMGDYITSFTFNGEEIPQSPFITKVNDTTGQCILIPKDDAEYGSFNTPIRFTVDTSKAGHGDLLVTCKSPSSTNYPVEVKAQKNGFYSVTFTPKTLGEYTTRFVYNGQDIPKSPFITHVGDTGKCVIIPKEGAEQGFLNKPAFFTVETNRAGPGNLQVTCQSPTGLKPDYPVDIRPLENGKYSVAFTPKLLGDFTTRFLFNGAEIPKSPFVTPVADPSMCVAHGEGLKNAIVGEPAKFRISLHNAGSGPLEILIKDPENKTVPVELSPAGDEDDTYNACYRTTEQGPYKIDVKFAHSHARGSPFVANSIDPSWASMKVVPLEHGRVNTPFLMNLNTPQNAAQAKMTAKVRDPNGNEIPVELIQGQEGCQINFKPSRPGDHKLDIYYGGTLMPNCPVIITVDEPGTNSKMCFATGEGLHKGIVNEKSSFYVDAQRAGNGRLWASLSGVKYNTSVEVKDNGNGTYTCHYLVPLAGAYILSVKYDEHHIPGSPYKVTVLNKFDPSRCVLKGHALKDGGCIGEPLQFELNTRDAPDGQLHVACQGPTKEARVSVQDNKDGTCSMKLHPTEPGKHLLCVEWDGIPIKGSPFMIHIGYPTDASKVRIQGPGVENGKLSTFKGNFIVETRGAGAGTLKIRIHGPRGAFKVEMFRDNSRDRTIGVRYNPREVGIYKVNVTWGEQPVPGSPFTVQIVETDKELETLNELKDNIIINGQIEHL